MDMCLTAMVVVNPDISIETVSRLVGQWQEGAMEDGANVVEQHISSRAVMRAMMEQRECFEQPIS